MQRRALIAYRNDHSVKFVNNRNFDEAMKIIRPSVNDEIMNEYIHIMDDFKFKQNGHDSFPFYG